MTCRKAWMSIVRWRRAVQARALGNEECLDASARIDGAGGVGDALNDRAAAW